MRRYFMESRRIGFSCWTVEDEALALLLWGDPDVSRYICASGVFTHDEILSRLSLEVERGERLGVQYWPIFELSTGELIGCCGLRPYGDIEGAFEIGFHLRPGFWRRGLAREAAERVIEYAFSCINAKELHAGHNPKNTASQALLLKIGFVPTGEEFYPPTGLMHPSYVMKK